MIIMIWTNLNQTMIMILIFDHVAKTNRCKFYSLSLSLSPSPSVKTAGGSGEHAGHPFSSHLKSMRRVKYVNCYSIVITNLI